MAILTSKPRAAAGLDAILLNVTTFHSAGFMEIRSGAQPANVATAATGTLLASLALSDQTLAFDATNTTTLKAVGRLISGKFAEDVSINTGGTAGWFRLYDNGGTAILDGTVGTSGANNLIFNTLTFVAGQPVQIDQFDITIGGLT